MKAHESSLRAGTGDPGQDVTPTDPRRYTLHPFSAEPHPGLVLGRGLGPEWSPEGRRLHIVAWEEIPGFVDHFLETGGLPELRVTAYTHLHVIHLPLLRAHKLSVSGSSWHFLTTGRFELRPPLALRPGDVLVLEPVVGGPTAPRRREVSGFEPPEALEPPLPLPVIVATAQVCGELEPLPDGLEAAGPVRFAYAPPMKVECGEAEVVCAVEEAVPALEPEVVPAWESEVVPALEPEVVPALEAEDEEALETVRLLRQEHPAQAGLTARCDATPGQDRCATAGGGR